MNKFDIQDSQYREPYHHYVGFGTPGLQRHMRWGLRYYGYITRVLELASAAAPQNLAEVGCGDGKILLELAQRCPAARFSGYDLSQKAIAFAKAFAWGRDNLNFTAGDFAESPGGYDVILCIETLEHIPDAAVAPFLATIRNKLAPDGRVILTVPSANYPVTQKHYRHYTLDLLRQQTESQFAIEHVEHLHDPRSRFLNYLLVNRLFLMNSPRLARWVFARYARKYRHAAERTAQHLLVVLR
jgi:SAM-dependent methyltransferase